MKHIVTQDRDRIIEFTGAEALYAQAATSGGRVLGVNLMMNGRILGTFDWPEQVVAQISKIFSSKEEIVVVDGYNSGEFI